MFEDFFGFMLSPVRRPVVPELPLEPIQKFHQEIEDNIQTFEQEILDEETLFVPTFSETNWLDDLAGAVRIDYEGERAS